MTVSETALLRVGFKGVPQLGFDTAQRLGFDKTSQLL